ncbi:hypothetical protein M9H77_26710 [Catharanthus roseus]|uniref:Uncharacterized protein n=1 Tax=Catharanthus roseus TaxID=4058 RepID=A0ACC0AD58_CATRO|nr:hypothetical protein M9H77_26710 [Catharanthus roseus]
MLGNVTLDLDPVDRGRSTAGGLGPRRITLTAPPGCTLVLYFCEFSAERHAEAMENIPDRSWMYRERGFGVKAYEEKMWSHSEKRLRVEFASTTRSKIRVESSRSMPIESNSYREMIFYVAGPNFFPQEEMNHEELPNPEAKKFFDMLKEVETPLVDGDDRYSVLSTTTELLYIKFENQ